MGEGSYLRASEDYYDVPGFSGLKRGPLSNALMLPAMIAKIRAYL